MKKYLLIFLAVSSAILGCSSNPMNSSKEQSVQPVATLSSGCTQSAAMIAWEKLSQATKDSKILNLANSENGTVYTGPNQCKGWVTSEVLAASSGAINIPQTCGDQRYWATDPCMPIYGRSTLITNVGPADILQMYWYVRYADGTFHLEPHTAIVVSKNSTGMVWVDCNYVGPGNNNIAIHPMSYADFNLFTTPTAAHSNLGWSVYHVQ
jgi:hypothetical protein